MLQSRFSFAMITSMIWDDALFSIAGSQRFPVKNRYQTTVSSTTTKGTSPVVSLLNRLVQSRSSSSGSGSGSVVSITSSNSNHQSATGSQRSSRPVQTLSPLRKWLFENGIASISASGSASSEGEDNEETDTSPAYLRTLIRRVLDATSGSASTPAPATEEAETRPSSTETKTFRISDLIGHLLGNHPLGVGGRSSTGRHHTQTNTTSTAASQLMTIIGRLMETQRPSESADGDDVKNTSADNTNNRKTFDLMSFIRRLMGAKERPTDASEGVGNKGTVVEIPIPMSSRAALRAFARWMSRLDRSSPDSPNRFASIIMKLLSRMVMSRSPSSTTAPSDDTAAPSSTSSSLTKWLLGELKNLRSSARTSSDSSSLTKWLRAFHRPGDSRGALITKPSSPLIQWLRAVQSSGKESSGRPATTSHDWSIVL